MSLKEDYLEVDKPIPGQNYVCLSFVSPEQTLRQKNLNLFHKYMNSRYNVLIENIERHLKKAPEDLKNKITKNVIDDIKLALNFSYDQFNESLEDFKFKHGEEVNDAFDKQNDFQTSVRGLKIRGVYNTYKEAQIRSQVLQRMDRSFNVFIGQVGYWLPWNPEADKIDEQEYMEDDLNKLMKEYKKNEIKRDIFYDEQKRELQKDSNVGLKDEIMKELKAEKTQNVENEVISSLEGEDPWTQRKREESENNSSEINVDISGNDNINEI